MGKRSSGFIYFWIFVYQQNIYLSTKYLKWKIYLWMIYFFLTYFIDGKTFIVTFRILSSQRRVQTTFRIFFCRGTGHVYRTISYIEESTEHVYWPWFVRILSSLYLLVTNFFPKNTLIIIFFYNFFFSTRINWLGLFLFNETTKELTYFIDGKTFVWIYIFISNIVLINKYFVGKQIFKNI
jgi:hypothetical protein